MLFVGAEEETGGHEAADVSIGMESVCQLCKRRVAATRWLVPLTGVSQYCLSPGDSSQNRIRQLFEDAFHEGILWFLLIIILVLFLF